MRIWETVSPVIRVVWWISIVWLAVGFLGEAWWYVKYLSEPDNPSRYEAGIGAMIFFFYSWPAAVGMLVAVLVPRTGLSTPRRLIGFTLLLCCIIMLYLFKGAPDSLQITSTRA
jgi:hypothetical protein